MTISHSMQHPDGYLVFTCGDFIGVHVIWYGQFPSGWSKPAELIYNSMTIGM